MRGDTKFGPAQIPPLPSLSSPFIASFPTEKRLIKAVWNIGQYGQGHSALRPILNMQTPELPANVVSTLNFVTFFQDLMNEGEKSIEFDGHVCIIERLCCAYTYVCACMCVSMTLCIMSNTLWTHEKT
mgnify:FL=1